MPSSICPSRCRRPSPASRSRALCAQRLGRRSNGALARLFGHQDRLYADRHRHRARLHRPALRRAHGAAGARGDRPEVEEAAATLGANRWQTITPRHPAAAHAGILTGFALAFARAVGEYGSVIFIAGNLPNVSEIAPLLIVIKLEEFD
jgi:hypothetical protein